MESVQKKFTMPAGHLIIGSLFWCLAFLTFLTALVAYKEQTLFSPMAIVYILLNIVIGYGFITKSAWIVSLLTLNFFGMLFISLLRIGGFIPYTSVTRIFTTILMSGFFALYALKLRPILIASPLFSFMPILFTTLWTIGILKILYLYVH